MLASAGLQIKGSALCRVCDTTGAGSGWCAQCTVHNTWLKKLAHLACGILLAYDMCEGPAHDQLSRHMLQQRMFSWMSMVLPKEEHHPSDCMPIRRLACQCRHIFLPLSMYCRVSTYARPTIPQPLRSVHMYLRTCILSRGNTQVHLVRAHAFDSVYTGGSIVVYPFARIRLDTR